MAVRRRQPAKRPRQEKVKVSGRHQLKKTKALLFAEKFKTDKTNKQMVFLLTRMLAKTNAAQVARFLGVHPTRVNRIERVINAANLITSLEAAKRLNLPFTPQVSLAIKELMQVKPKKSKKLLADFKRF